MSLFGSLDLENASDDPFDMPADFYDLRITDVFVKPGKKNPTHNFLVIEYTVENSGEYDGDTVQGWHRIPDAGDDSKAARQALAYLKQRLGQLGVPENKMNTVEKDDLLNIEVVAYLEKNGGFMNISNQEGHFRLRSDAPSAKESATDDGGFAADPGF